MLEHILALRQLKPVLLYKFFLMHDKIIKHLHAWLHSKGLYMAPWLCKIKYNYFNDHSTLHQAGHGLFSFAYQANKKPASTHALSAAKTRPQQHWGMQFYHWGLGLNLCLYNGNYSYLITMNGQIFKQMKIYGRCGFLLMPIVGR